MCGDITTFIKNNIGFQLTINQLVDRYMHQKIDMFDANKSRGFILGYPLAFALGLGFVLIRKN